MCTALIYLCALTHCDTTNAYKGVVNGRPIKLLQKTEAFQDALTKLGYTREVPTRLDEELEQFACPTCIGEHVSRVWMDLVQQS